MSTEKIILFFGTCGKVTKHLQIRLEEKEYEEVESAAKALGLSLTAYGQRELLRVVRAEQSGPFGALTKKEEHLLSGLLAYLRQRPYSPEKAEIVALFERLANRGNTPIAK